MKIFCLYKFRKIIYLLTYLLHLVSGAINLGNYYKLMRSMEEQYIKNLANIENTKSLTMKSALDLYKDIAREQNIIINSKEEEINQIKSNEERQLLSIKADKNKENRLLQIDIEQLEYKIQRKLFFRDKLIIFISTHNILIK